MIEQLDLGPSYTSIRNPIDYTLDYTLEYVLEKIWEKSDSNTIFVDIGGFIGYFSLLAAKHNIRTIAFEPVAGNCHIFGKNILNNRLSHIISLYMLPLSESDAYVTLNIPKADMSLCTIRQIPTDCIAYQQTMKGEKFDRIFSLTKKKKYIVKISVEGHEKAVLKGMRENLANYTISHILIKLHTPDPEIFQILSEYDITRPGHTEKYTQDMLTENFAVTSQTNHVWIQATRRKYT